MSVKVILNDKKEIVLEVRIELENENFLETEELIMDKVNEVGKKITEEALKNLETEEKVLVLNEESLYSKEVKKNIKHLMERSR